jgi:hypothetical protein
MESIGGEVSCAIMFDDNRWFCPVGGFAFPCFSCVMNAPTMDRFFRLRGQTSFDRTTRFIIFLVEEAWLVDLFDWIETGLVWLADGAAWRRLLIFDKIWVGGGGGRRNVSIK